MDSPTNSERTNTTPSFCLAQDAIGFGKDDKPESSRSVALLDPDSSVRPEEILAKDSSEEQETEIQTLAASDPCAFSLETAELRLQNKNTTGSNKTSACHVSDMLDPEVPEDVPPISSESTKHKIHISPKYTLGEKCTIVWEAFSKPKNVRLTLQKYKISHGSIYHWRSLFEHADREKSQNICLAHLNQQGIVGTYSQQFTTDEAEFAVLPDSKCTAHRGRQSEIPEWARVHLTRYFDSLHSLNHHVLIHDLCTEYLTICPDETEPVTFSALCQRVYRWLKHEHIVDCAITHQAQKGDYCLQRINNWVAFIRQQIETYSIKEENVANFDETNVDFTIEAKQTLSRKGEKSIQSVSSSSSSRAMVMLGATMTGEKVSSLCYI